MIVAIAALLALAPLAAAGRGAGRGRDVWATARSRAAARARSAPRATPALVGAGTIHGTVTDAVSKAGVAGVEVCAWPLGEEEGDGGCAESGAGGIYKLSGLPAGTYLVEFSTPFDGAVDYVFQYFPGATSRAGATEVHLGAGGSFEANAAMVEGGQLSGRVTASGGPPIAGIEVCAWEVEGISSTACGETKAGGEYVLRGLATGSYKVGYRSFPKSNLHYLTRYYQEALSPAAAKQVAVTEGKTTPGVEEALPEGGGIAGTVKLAGTEEGDPDAEVCPFSASETELECAGPEDSGAYEIPALPAGAYYVEFFDPRFEPQLYDEAFTLETARQVVVQTGLVTPGVDAALAPSAVPPGLLGEAFPEIFGTIAVGSTVSCSQGSWTGTAPISYSYQWLDTKVPIPGATGTTYTITASDVGKFLACLVTATNRAGSQAAKSIGYRVPVPIATTQAAPPASSPGTPPAVAVLPAKIVVPALALLGRVTAAGGRATVRLRCALGPCHGTLRLLGRVTRHVRTHGHTVTRHLTIVLGTGSFSLAEGATGTATIHLTAAGRSQLRQARRHPRAERLGVALAGASASIRAVVVN